MRFAFLRRLRMEHYPKRAKRSLVFAGLVLIFSVYFFVGLQSPLLADAANYPTLSIPSIGLDTPVAPVELVDHQLEAPATIAGIYTPTPNKMFIIGHSTTVFSKLHEASTGDEFTYDSNTYTINNIVTLEKSAISMSKILAAADRPTIIIMTCAGELLPNQDATHRLIITATIKE